SARFVHARHVEAAAALVQGGLRLGQGERCAAAVRSGLRRSVDVGAVLWPSPRAGCIRSPRPNTPGEPVSSSLLDKRQERIRRMFAGVAPRYDLLNPLLSLNVDRYWRWRTTRLVPPVGGAPILDVCTGTGDLALAYDRASGGRAPVVGTDFCGEMLLPAVAKAR